MKKKKKKSKLRKRSPAWRSASAQFNLDGPSGKLVRCPIIFRGQGKRISAVERAAYHAAVKLYFQ